ncbi:zinc ABC transporter ATP-binding protein [Candidatus Aerophobetes bacterium]|uniref:Zinc ABC transporter ATP-binding protein n=1 Tax=Aerophobetes bacterium TaxID=2030807 RepID=A0A2A4YKY6_UNCAE|nr:MAG: zinc ABC transporter ATP-binding protein [Candidatus Aerophobetes bacterium]
MKNTVLDLQEIDFSYTKEPCINKACLKIFQNQFVGVIGPNGSGKTTLLKLMMGLLEPTKGEILLFDKAPKKSFSKIGYVPQVRIYDQKFPISVLDVVLMGALSKLTISGKFPKEIKEKAFSLMDTIGLTSIQDQCFGTLSGGQAQRVLIARAILNDPEILFLDEPTFGLDVETQSLIVDLLVKLKQSMTIVMVTHHLQSFIKHLDTVFCVQQEVTELKPEEVCEHFALGVYHSPLINKKGDPGCC